VSEEKSPFGVLWDFFCSLRLTIFILIALAVTSIIGTIIPQGRKPGEYIQAYGDNAYSLIALLDFEDMYHAWWFLGLLVLFCLNLMACSIKRLPRVLKAIKNPNFRPDERFYRSLSNQDNLQVSAPAPEVRQRVARFIESRFGKMVQTEEGEKIHLFAQKAPYARLGVYVTHLSILLILAGAIIGNIWGFKAFVNIAEGTAADKVRPTDGGPPIELGFTVHVDDFDVSYYEGSARPREYMSILNVIDGGEKVIEKRKIVVNDPLTYQGITFYQSSYGPAGDPVFKMQVKPSGGDAFEVAAPLGKHIPLPDGSSFAVTNYTPSYKRFGPAIEMHLNTPDGRHGNPFLLFQNFPEFGQRREGPFSFSVMGWDQLQFTGLQVKKDPGVWVVWAGCFLLVAGSLVAFFLSHRRLWATIAPDGGKTAIFLGGSAHRNQPAFALFFERFRDDLREELLGKESALHQPDAQPIESTHGWRI